MKGQIMSTGPLNSLDVTLTEGGGASNNGADANKNGYLPLCFSLCDQKQQSPKRTQTEHSFKIGSFLPSLAPEKRELL